MVKKKIDPEKEEEERNEVKAEMQMSKTEHDEGGEVEEKTIVEEVIESKVQTYPWSVLEPKECEKDQKIIGIYGPSGSGKTSLIGQFPNLLLLGCDPGRTGGALPALKFKPKFLKVTSYDHILELIPMLQEGFNNEQFDIIGIDSMTYLTKMTMGEILQVVHREIPRFEEWNLLVERIRRLMVNITDIGADVIFSATDNIQKADITGQMFGGPDLPGRLSKELPQVCDIVARTYAQTSIVQNKTMAKYFYSITPDDIWFAKDRTSKLPLSGEITCTKENERAGYNMFKVIFG